MDPSQLQQNVGLILGAIIALIGLSLLWTTVKAGGSRGNGGGSGWLIGFGLIAAGVLAYLVLSGTVAI